MDSYTIKSLGLAEDLIADISAGESSTKLYRTIEALRASLEFL